MKRFFIYLLAVLIPIAIALGIGEWCVRSVENTYSFKRKIMLLNHEKTETLVLGASHTYFGIKPDLLDGNAISLAFVSQQPKYDEFLLKQVEYPCLKNVILGISYSTFFNDRLENKDVWYMAMYYKIYMHYPEHSDFSYYNYEFFDMDNYRKKLGHFFRGEDVVDCDLYGWGRSYSLEKKNMKKWNDEDCGVATEEDQRGKWPEAERFAQGHLATVTRIADFCAQKGARLILVTTPCHDKYTRLLKQHQLRRMHELISDIMKTHDVTYLDYLYDKRFGDDDFFDVDHLSDVGAVKFTKLLNADIQRTASTAH